MLASCAHAPGKPKNVYDGSMFAGRGGCPHLRTMHGNEDKRNKVDPIVVLKKSFVGNDVFHKNCL